MVRKILLLGAALALIFSARAGAVGLDRAFEGALLGPDQAKGIVIWSHGRSITEEGSKAATPAYLMAAKGAGYDVMRFNRLSRGDVLDKSSTLLVSHVRELKQKGYREVVLAGQSFGAFLSLLAANTSHEVDAVIATAPAAYGDFHDFYDSWRFNATKLYPLLAGIKSAKIMLFYFHDDSYDPGGRGEWSRQILSVRGIQFAVIDQPPYLKGHWAASEPRFEPQFGPCIVGFLGNNKTPGEFTCRPTSETLASGLSGKQ